MSMISTRIFHDGATPLQRTVTVVFAGSERPGVGLVIETPPTLCCAHTTGIMTINASRARSDDAAARNVLAGIGPSRIRSAVPCPALTPVPSPNWGRTLPAKEKME